jgi:stage V sporulation protein G
MEVTEIRLRLRDEEKLKAFASVTFDDCFVVRDLKVIDGTNGLFVAMPSRRMPDGTFKDVAHPLNNETRRMIEAKVLAKYKEELEAQRASTAWTATPERAEIEEPAGPEGVSEGEDKGK